MAGAWLTPSWPEAVGSAAAAGNLGCRRCMPPKADIVIVSPPWLGSEHKMSAHQRFV